MSSEIDEIDRTRKRRQERQEREPAGPALGILAFGLAVVTVVLLIVGMALAISGKFAPSTTVAYVAVAVSIMAALIGLAAVLLRRGRVWGFFAVVLAAVANPVVLTRLLGWASGLG